MRIECLKIHWRKRHEVLIGPRLLGCLLEIRYQIYFLLFRSGFSEDHYLIKTGN